MSWVKPFLGGLFSAAALFGPAPAFCDVPTRLIYVRTPEAATCPEQAALEKAVSARLGHDPFSIWGEQTIIATIAAAGATLRARAELVDGSGVRRGSREVLGRASECDELILALALAISITLDPMQVPAAPPATAPAPPPSAEAGAAPLVPADSTPETAAPAPGEQAPPAPSLRPVSAARASAPPVQLSLHGGFFGSVGALPTLTPGARLGFAVDHARLRIGAEGSGSLPSTQSEKAGREVVVSSWFASLFPCFAFARGVFACALGSLGAFHAYGAGVSEPRSETLLYSALGVRLAFELPLGRDWFFASQADLTGTLTRPEFSLNQATVWRPPPVSAALGLGLRARFL